MSNISKKTLIFLIGLLLTVTIFLSLTPILNNKSKKNEEMESGAYIDRNAYLIDNANNLESNYDKYTYFRIDSNSAGTITPKTGFTELVKFLQKNIDNKYFSGKIVYMNANVTIDSDFSIPRFDGTWDGQGHTIFVSSSYTYETDGAGDFTPFINKNNGTIKNLKISDVNVFIEAVVLNSTKSRVAALVNVNNGTIDGCIVNNCKFTSDRGESYCLVTTFCVTNSGTISNCMATGTLTLDLDAKSNGIKSCYFVITGTEATNSIWAATCNEDSDNTDNCYTPSENKDSALDEGKGNFNSCSDAYNKMSSDYMSSSAGSSEIMFHKYPKDQYGYDSNSAYCVYLRAFISWSTIYFDTNGDGDYDTTASCASNCVSLEASSVVLDMFEINFYASTIYPSSTTGGVNADGWEKIDDTHYKAKFIAKTYVVYFDTCDNAKTTVNGVEFSSKQSFLVTHGEVISIYFTTLSTGKYSKIKFSFNDSSDNSNEVEYCVSNTHYFENYLLDNEFKTDTSIKIEKRMTFNLIAELRTYIPEYK